MAEEYEAFGLTYDVKKDQWYFNGEKVRYFQDVLTSNAGVPHPARHPTSSTPPRTDASSFLLCRRYCISMEANVRSAIHRLG